MKGEEKNEEYIELPEEEKKTLLTIKIEKALDIRDVERIIKVVREGNVCIVSLRDVKKNIPEYQALLENFKRYSNMFKVNIYLLGEDYILLTPKEIKVEK